jgi:hypothetical protein
MATSTRTSARRMFLTLGTAAVSLAVLPRTAAAKGSKAPAASPLVTYSGLRVYEDGSSTLQVNLTKAAPVELGEQGARLVYLIKGAKIELRNNKNPLRAEYFSSNVMSSKLDDSKDGARLEIQLRSPVTPVSEMIRHSGGVILRIEIPAPKK